MLILDLKTYFQKRAGNQACLAEKTISSREQPKSLCRGSGFKVHENLADDSLCLSKSCHHPPKATRALHASLSPKQPPQPRFTSAASLTSLPWSHPGLNSRGSCRPAPSGELFPSILESRSERISRWLFLCCY